MILPDVNLLIYAYNSDAPQHEAARSWWEDQLSGERPVGLPWAVLMGYLRLSTSRRVLVDPFEPVEAIGQIRSWLDCPNVTLLTPGSRHLDLVEDLLKVSGATGNLTTDIHLAALAIENQAELHSNDTDFDRFPGLKKRNPLKE